MKRLFLLLISIILLALFGCEQATLNCEHIWDNGVEIESGNSGYIMEFTCTVCGEKSQETITIIPPTPIVNNNLLFAIEDKINELTKYKTSILANINSNILAASITSLFDDCIIEINNAQDIASVTELSDKCLKDVYNLIPLANGDFDYSWFHELEKQKILSLLDDYIFRNNLGGIPISPNYTLNLNSTTKEQWIEFFGEEGSVCQTPVNEYWDVKEFLSNEYFLKGLCLAIPKEDSLDEVTDYYQIDYSNYEFFDFDLELSRKYFALAIEQLTPSYYVSSQYPIQLKLEIAFGAKTVDDEAIFNNLKNNIESAFNDQSVSNGNFVLTVEAWYGDYFGQIYTDKNHNGHFDLSWDKISGSSYDWYMMYKLLSSNPELSNDLTINWSIDTNNIETDCIVYNGYRFSYDALLSLLSSEYMILDGVAMPKLDEITLNEINDIIAPKHKVRLYLGQYNGYYVWVQPAMAAVVDTQVIGEYTFKYNTSFILYAFKDEKVVTVKNLYEEEVLTDDDIKQIHYYFSLAAKHNIICFS